MPDVPQSNLKLDLKPQSLTFTGHSETLKRTYHLELEFYAEIDPEASNVHHTAKNVELKLRKKELAEEYWPRLLKDSKKVHFLKTDFDKWVDEDEQNEAADDDLSNFGGMGKSSFLPPPFLMSLTLLHRRFIIIRFSGFPFSLLVSPFFFFFFLSLSLALPLYPSFLALF